MRILVTGASGFIGRHLLRRLVEAGCFEVFAVARGPNPESDPSVHWISVDLADHNDFAGLPSAMDAVVHLAQSRSYRTFPDGAPDVYRINVDATFQLLEWARSTGVRTLVHASTGSVYRPQPYRLTEGAATSADSFYAASKIAAEALCAAYAPVLPVTVLRLFAVYGPGPSDSVFSRLLRRIARGETIELDGGLGLITTPTYVTDCVDAIVQSLLTAEALRTFNICGDEEISLRDACVIFGALLNREPHLLGNDKSPARLSGDNSQARCALRWQPRHSLREGLTALVRAHREQ